MRNTHIDGGGMNEIQLILCQNKSLLLLMLRNWDIKKVNNTIKFMMVALILRLLLRDLSNSDFEAV